METKFIPKDPETLKDFDEVLAEYNRVNDTNLKFTDTYDGKIHLWVCEETTADGYGIYTIRLDGESVDMDTIYYYKPDAYAVFEVINQNNYYDEFVVYHDMEWEEFEEYMHQELYTNYDNYLQELEDNKEE
jgi:hypothetical protein